MIFKCYASYIGGEGYREGHDYGHLLPQIVWKRSPRNIN